MSSVIDLRFQARRTLEMEASVTRVEPLLNPLRTPMGTQLVPDKSGATFRFWAPRAKRIYVLGEFIGGEPHPEAELLRLPDGTWGGFVRGVRDGQQYKLFIEGEGHQCRKRDPYAREFTDRDPGWPTSNCVVRDPDAYPWRVRDFRPPAFNDLMIYQLHVGVFNGDDRPTRPAKFLDVLGKLEHLKATGINAIQLLPIVEVSSPRSKGYEGSDIYSPEMDFAVHGGEIDSYLRTINRLFAARGVPGVSKEDIAAHGSQLKVLVDLCHAYGIAVFLDVVYNHAGGQMMTQEESLWFFDNYSGFNKNDSVYFTDRDHCGPVWAIWKQEVRQFLIDNVVFFVREYQIDGFRYDETSAIVRENVNDGWRFCQDMTGTVRYVDPSVIQIAEYWNPGPDPWVVRSRGEGGAGFDACWHDGLRNSIRDAIRSASYGGSSRVDVERIAASLWPAGIPDAWRAVQCIENHDEVKTDDGGGPRIPQLADGSNPISPYATSRARVATGLLFTAPGIPMLFMGQELLESHRWSDDPKSRPDSLIDWDALDQRKRPAACDFYHFVQALTWLRATQPALRGNRLHVIHANNGDRVLAFHRWLEGEGRDVIVVASLNDDTFPSYDVGFPGTGHWREIFNSAFPEDGNGYGIDAFDQPLHGMPATARIRLPRRSICVFAR